MGTRRRLREGWMGLALLFFGSARRLGGASRNLGSEDEPRSRRAAGRAEGIVSRGDCVQIRTTEESLSQWGQEGLASQH